METPNILPFCRKVDLILTACTLMGHYTRCFVLSIKALVSPENWAGKKGKHLKRVLMEAHDAAIILINPTDADKFLQASVEGG